MGKENFFCCWNEHLMRCLLEGEGEKTLDHKALGSCSGNRQCPVKMAASDAGKAERLALAVLALANPPSYT